MLPEQIAEDKIIIKRLVTNYRLPKHHIEYTLQMQKYQRNRTLFANGEPVYVYVYALKEND